MFAEHPAQRIDDIRLAAAIWPDNSGNALIEIDFGWIDKRFKTGHFQPFQPHLLLIPVQISNDEVLLPVHQLTFAGKGGSVKDKVLFSGKATDAQNP